MLIIPWGVVTHPDKLLLTLFPLQGLTLMQMWLYSTNCLNQSLNHRYLSLGSGAESEFTESKPSP